MEAQQEQEKQKDRAFRAERGAAREAHAATCYTRRSHALRYEHHARTRADAVLEVKRQRLDEEMSAELAAKRAHVANMCTERAEVAEARAELRNSRYGPLTGNPEVRDQLEQYEASLRELSDLQAQVRSEALTLMSAAQPESDESDVESRAPSDSEDEAANAYEDPHDPPVPFLPPVPPSGAISGLAPPRPVIALELHNQPLALPPLPVARAPFTVR